MINVTKSYLPDISEYITYINKVWESGWLTNNGELIRELEKQLKDFLDVKHLFIVSNGTIAIQIAIKALELKGEIITTPFSYVATTTSILWENCTPIFADINPVNYCIDFNKIESLITEKTSAILPTHVYGYPCEVEKIEKIANNHKLKVIYDSAHAFGVTYKNQSLLKYGDISTLSFHATKLFHMIEGGAIITNDDSIAEKISLYRSFGHIYDDYISIGVNGKNSEFHAAMGLCNLPKVSTLIEKRKVISTLYDKNFSNISSILRPQFSSDTGYNYAYYPIFFESEEKLLAVFDSLVKNNITPRRYFFPSLNKLPYLDNTNPCPVSESYSKRVLCLPLYDSLSLSDVDRISQIVIQSCC